MTTRDASSADAVVEEIARSFSLYDPETMRAPHKVYDELRGKCPVAHSEQDGGFFIVTGYDDINAVTRDTDTYSSREILVPKSQFGDFNERPPVTTDPPRHSHYRRLLLPGFTLAKSQMWEPVIRQIVIDALTPLTSLSKTNVAESFCKKIPLGFMCALMGVPAEMEDRFTKWAHDTIESTDQEAAMQSVGEIAAFFTEQLAQRAESPTEDLITTLMNSEVDGSRLEGQELIGVLMVVLLAGLDTTWSVMSSMFLHLATNPGDRQRLVEDPDLIPSFVEESLRFYAPVTLARETTQETVLHDVTIPESSMVLLAWPGANRDPSVFPDADKFLVDREENRHLAFGSGIHRCVGAPFARLELRIAIEEWLKAIPDFELDDADAVTYATGHTWGPRTVPITYAPVAP